MFSRLLRASGPVARLKTGKGSEYYLGLISVTFLQIGGIVWAMK